MIKGRLQYLHKCKYCNCEWFEFKNDKSVCENCGKEDITKTQIDIIKEIKKELENKSIKHEYQTYMASYNRNGKDKFKVHQINYNNISIKNHPSNPQHIKLLEMILNEIKEGKKI